MYMMLYVCIVKKSSALRIDSLETFFEMTLALHFWMFTEICFLHRSRKSVSQL